MSWYWYFAYALAMGAIVFDLLLELRGRKTISEYVWESGIPQWVWYALGLVLFNLAFWLISGWVAFLVLAGWLLGHFAR